MVSIFISVPMCCHDNQPVIKVSKYRSCYILFNQKQKENQSSSSRPHADGMTGEFS